MAIWRLAAVLGSVAAFPVPGPPPALSRREAVFSHARNGDYAKAASLIHGAKAAGKRVHAAEIGAAINAAGKQGLWREGVGLLHLLEEEDLETVAAKKVFTQAIQACGRAQRWRQALAVLDRMRQRSEPDAFAYNAALSACARAGQVEPMLAVLRNMSANGCAPDKVSYTIAMDGCARAGLTSTAIRLFDAMGQGSAPAPDAVCYNAAIAACARPTASAPSAWKEALRILKQMDTASGGPGVSLKAVSGAMAACTNARQHAAAIGLYQRLPTAFGLTPDVIACSTAIAAHSRSGQYGSSLRVFRSMKRDWNLRRDVVSYNTLLHACATVQRRSLGVRHAARLRALMKAERVAPDDVTHSVLLQSLWHTDHATVILDEAMLGRARSDGAFARCLSVRALPPSGLVWELDLHDLSPGAAVAMVLWLLSQLAKLEVSGTPPVAGGGRAPSPRAGRRVSRSSRAGGGTAAATSSSAARKVPCARPCSKL